MTFRKLYQGEEGQALLVMALSLTVIIAFLGLAIDVGHLRYEKHRLRVAADAAALAAGLEIRFCGTSTNCTAMQNAAQSALAENGYSVTTVLTKTCTAPTSTAVTLVVNSPPCLLGSNDPNSIGATNVRFVETLVTENVRTYFGRIVGFDNIQLSARAEATRNPGPNCIFALDTSGSGAINIPVAALSSSNCGIVDESISNTSLVCGIGLINFSPRIVTAGGAASLLCGLNTPVHTHVPAPVPTDPLAYLPAPANANAACPTSTQASQGNNFSGSGNAINLLLIGTYTFNPGVYCGGISITASVLMNVTFNPGVYILKKGPGSQGGLNITLTALSSIVGTGVTFYNTYGGYSISIPTPVSLSVVNLSAPTSGTYGGMLFMQAPTNYSRAVFLANLLTGSKLEGAFYFPAAPVSYAVGAISSNYNILVAQDINFTIQVLSTFGNNYAALTVGSPLYGDRAVLVQ